MNEYPVKDNVFEKNMNPAKYHKVVCAIDFGTSGTGYSYGFTKPGGDIDLASVFIHAPWPLAGASKTATAVLFNKSTNDVTFGKKAVDEISKVLSKNRANYDFYQGFKMDLYRSKVTKSKAFVKDINTGAERSAVDVIAACFKEVKAAFMSQIKLVMGSEFSIKEQDILWVITVPAIWKDGAKHLMREAARVAGLVDRVESPSLILVLEPEAASIWCLRTNLAKLKKDSIYIVADCGGGTIDVTVHEIIDDDVSRIKEAIPVGGGDWGSTFINKQFFELIKELVGETVYRKFVSETKDYMKMQEKFESLKVSFEGDGNESMIQMSRMLTGDADGLHKAINNYNAKNLTDLDFDDEEEDLILTESVVLKLMEASITKTVSHLESIVKKSKASTIFLVGNFANSKPLQRALKKNLGPSVTLIVPPLPGTCVANGAVILGNNPRLIDQRISRTCYGVSEIKLFKPTIHSDSPYMNKLVRNNKEYVCNAMDWFITSGESIQVGKTITRKYYGRVGDTSLTVHFYQSEGTGGVYSKDPKNQFLGSITTSGLNSVEISKTGVVHHILFGSAEIFTTVYRVIVILFGQTLLTLLTSFKQRKVFIRNILHTQKAYKLTQPFEKLMMVFTLPLHRESQLDFSAPQDYSTTFEFDEEEADFAEDDDEFSVYLNDSKRVSLLNSQKSKKSATAAAEPLSPAAVRSSIASISEYFRKSLSPRTSKEVGSSTQNSSGWFSFQNGGSLELQTHDTFQSINLKSVETGYANVQHADNGDDDSALTINELNDGIDDVFHADPPSLSQILPSLVTMAVANLILPVIIYYVVAGLLKASQILGLVLSAIPPTIEAVHNVVSRRRIDAIATVVVSSILMNIGILVITSNVTVGLLRESFITLIFGMVFLLSTTPWVILYLFLLEVVRKNVFRMSQSYDPSQDATDLNISKNLVFFLMRELGGSNSDIHTQSKIAYFDNLWERSVSFRIATRALSKVWGVTLLLEAVTRCVLAILLQNYSIELFLILSPSLFALTFGLLIIGTIWYIQRVIRRESYDENSGVRDKDRVQERLNGLVKNKLRNSGERKSSGIPRSSRIQDDAERLIN
ncbi:hypothetical protein HK096_002121 [Nowakowskiella sp. JEL0078]|nr:hypothetical protein HK096_002121 [Nowakowskiella sp. JEL0078]